MRAANQGHTEIVKLLLKNGANINTHDKKGNTARDHLFLMTPTPHNEENFKPIEKLLNEYTNKQG